MNLLLLLLSGDKCIYFGSEQVSPFSFKVIHIGESLLEFGIFIVSDFALGELKVLLQYLYA
jgi:hypothetical protein